ncbi:MAG: zinc ribbon domain-containing protein [Candidatus Omnitrophica bacterium]|nr:zinc ribbon domain-containing protein [Candidatus Omnitrophota bacterium]MCM8831378.1 zinc ribbon domain-containing protein [Candidatus Omnitrophota bacterium]
MPIYTYFCKICKKKFDLLIRTTEQKISCPYCNNTNLEKQFSVFGVVSKGGGDLTSSSSSGKCSGCSGGNCSSCF